MFEKIKYNSDFETVSKNWPKISIQYHYSWMESVICKHLGDNHKSVFDVGCGYGHWLRFYENIGFGFIQGIEISKTMADRLNVYNDNIVNYRHAKYDVINAIGVLHHIMKDKDLIKAIDNINAMATDVIFIGTRFDFFESPKEKNRKYRPLKFWEDHLNVVAIERSNPGRLNKHLDLIVAKK